MIIPMFAGLIHVCSILGVCMTLVECTYPRVSPKVQISAAVLKKNECL